MTLIKAICISILLAAVPVQAGVNIFNKAYAGTRNDLTGRRGFSFVALKDFAIDSMGRFVGSGTLHASHTVELYDVQSALLLASVTVNDSSVRDTLGYAFESVGQTPVSIQSGRTYMILQSETAGDGDLWFAGYMPNYQNSYIAVKGGQWSPAAGTMPPVRSETDNEYGYGPPAFTLIDPQMNAATWGPLPADGAVQLEPFASLWTTGGLTWHAPLAPVHVAPDQVLYNVYFGTDPDQMVLVSAAQSQTIWWPTFILNMGPVTYYWRVDTLDGPAIMQGSVWSFSTKKGGSVAGDIGGPQGYPDSTVDLNDLAQFISQWLN